MAILFSSCNKPFSKDLFIIIDNGLLIELDIPLTNLLLKPSRPVVFYGLRTLIIFSISNDVTGSINILFGFLTVLFK